MDESNSKTLQSRAAAERRKQQRISTWIFSALEVSTASPTADLARSGGHS